jgi:hypothetical protein
MNISRKALCFASLSVLLLWIQSGSGIAGTNCQQIGNDHWTQWTNGSLPRTDAIIAKLMKIKQDCPQLDKSMSSMVNGIKAHQQKEGAASSHVKKAGEKYQSSAYDPGGIPGRS